MVNKDGNYGQIFLQFDNVNQVIENPIPKFRQNSLFQRNQVIFLRN